ncbi:hypothetical protein [Massilia aquatica]|uniref:Regulatory protein RecX n=1 Tax=Massilia aquatica TaxID=2609000 RepID=A0ABX0M613_9BURK|nr:hypothetical protein [Massilia aquatica]NHZ42671.1 hypothetical protein [Massilia aquatica]
MTDCRQDSKTAAFLLEALHRKRAFDQDAATKLLRKELVSDDLARAALVCTYERRQHHEGTR